MSDSEATPEPKPKADHEETIDRLLLHLEKNPGEWDTMGTLSDLCEEFDRPTMAVALRWMVKRGKHPVKLVPPGVVIARREIVDAGNADRLEAPLRYFEAKFLDCLQWCWTSDPERPDECILDGPIASEMMIAPTDAESSRSVYSNTYEGAVDRLATALFHLSQAIA